MVTRLEIQELAVGSLSATEGALIQVSLCVREWQMYKTKCLIRDQNYKNKISLSQECNSEINWWIQQFDIWNGKQIITGEPDLVLETDASKIGWGYYLEDIIGLATRWTTQLSTKGPARLEYFKIEQKS